MKICSLFGTINILELRILLAFAFGADFIIQLLSRNMRKFSAGVKAEFASVKIYSYTYIVKICDHRNSETARSAILKGA